MAGALDTIIAGDNPTMLADFGEPITFTGSPAGALAMLEVRGRHVLGRDHFGEVIATERTLLMLTTTAALLTVQMPIVWFGNSYVVRDIQADPLDGAFTLVGIQDATP